MKDSVGILVVNGGRDPKHGCWLELLTRNLARYTHDITFTLFVWNNNVTDQIIPEICNKIDNVVYKELEKYEELSHFHAVPLQRLYETARARGMKYILTMDSDAQPIKEGWLGYLTRAVSDETPLSGVWRDELARGIKPYIHASCLCTTVDFIENNQLRFDTVSGANTHGLRDTLSDFTDKVCELGLSVNKLCRSNQNNFHHLMGGIYNDMIYHHGAGSRVNITFWGGASDTYTRLLNTFLAERSAEILVTEYDSYIDWLRGREITPDVERKMRALQDMDKNKFSLSNLIRLGGRYAVSKLS